jgi:hypothetical protein
VPRVAEQKLRKQICYMALPANRRESAQRLAGGQSPCVKAADREELFCRYSAPAVMWECEYFCASTGALCSKCPGSIL